MKLNVWIVAALAPLTAALLLAQDTAPAPAASTKKAPNVKKSIVLDPPAPATVKNASVNVRGRASFTGETLGQLQKGDTVTVLEQITLSRTAQDEPAEWAQIALPAGIPVWVDAEFVDAAAKTIKARRVNVRGGPGENYSVLGRLEKGAAIKEIKKDKGWVAIEAPTNAYAFVAAEFLEMQPAPAVVVTPPPSAPAAVVAPAPEPPVVNVPAPAPPAAVTNEPVATAPVAPVPGAPPTDAAKTNEVAPASAPELVPTPATVTPPAPSEPPTPRIVTREGFVRRAYNIQAPADYELHDIQSGTLIDYLQPGKGQKFKIFVGTRVTVTGPEGMDPRWPRTPVLQVQTADLMP
jgi:uncharacterized protein YgiM (DUF1202 family)